MAAEPLPATAFFGGSGTIDDPYIITNVWELKNMSLDLTAHYVLGNDIDASMTRDPHRGVYFVPVGTDTNNFRGSLDGCNRIITGLYISGLFGHNIGLFGVVGAGAVVRNVGLVGNEITGKVNVGGLAGRNDGSVSGSYATGAVTGDRFVGGLVGSNSAIGSVSHSYAMGAITGDRFVGGLMGWNTGSLNDSYATGAATGLAYIGGLVGGNTGSVSRSYATGAITGTVIASQYVGGLAGTNWGDDSSIIDSYAMGSVVRASVSSNTEFGGFVGYNYRGKILNCYSTGAVHYVDTVDPTSNGFAGKVDIGGAYEMAGNFWNTETSGQVRTVGHAMGRTTSEMMALATFLAWNITHVRDHESQTWYIDDGLDYPRLLWEWYVDTHSPVADAGSDQNCTAGTTVTFNGSASTDNVGVMNYIWTFTFDGSAILLYSANPTFNFTMVGNYTITLTVWDAAGNADTDSMVVRVYPAADTSGHDNNTAGPGARLWIILIIVIIVALGLLVCMKKGRTPKKPHTHGQPPPPIL